MAHNRAERRRKTALIKRKLERIVQNELDVHSRYTGRNLPPYRPSFGCRGGAEHALRRRWFKNEGGNGRACWDCGLHACDWCLRDFYRKHVQREQALENDLREYLHGDYDALRDEGMEVPRALLVRLPQPMGRCETK
jgi:hypothetical protein